jgi:hypothetical protein
MPKKPTKQAPIPAKGQAARLWINIALGAVLITGAVWVWLIPSGERSVSPSAQPNAAKSGSIKSPATVASLSSYAKLKARDLVAMSDAELEAMDPLVMNIVVAKELPELAKIDIGEYSRIVDGWAVRIGKGLAATERAESGTELYKHDPDLWRAGGMAISLAGPSVGISYTRDVNLSNHADLFVPGLIDTRRGTCSNLPVVFMAVGYRLGWPIKAVVASDHMWCRWDDGKKRFNLEATSNTSDGQQGTFSSPPDDAYRADFKIPPMAEAVRSDLVTLTARQTLGVYLQQRAGYWRAKGKLSNAESDLHLALHCFPENRDIFRALLAAMDERAKELFTPEESTQLFSWIQKTELRAKRPIDWDQINREREKAERSNREFKRRWDEQMRSLQRKPEQ